MHEVCTIVHGFKVVNQGKDILMTHRDTLKNCDFIANLRECARQSSDKSLSFDNSVDEYHVLATSHQALINDFGRKVTAGLNMDAFLHDRV